MPGLKPSSEGHPTRMWVPAPCRKRPHIAAWCAWCTYGGRAVQCLKGQPDSSDEEEAERKSIGMFMPAPPRLSKMILRREDGAAFQLLWQCPICWFNCDQCSCGGSVWSALIVCWDNSGGSEGRIPSRTSEFVLAGMCLALKFAEPVVSDPPNHDHGKYWG